MQLTRQCPSGITTEGCILNNGWTRRAFMDKFVIRGGNPLGGTLRVGGAKNAALPAMAASILTGEPGLLEKNTHVPHIQTQRNLLVFLCADGEPGFRRPP